MIDGPASFSASTMISEPGLVGWLHQLQIAGKDYAADV
jgi:hypothetical protein